MTEDMKRHFKYEMDKQTGHALTMRAEAAKAYKEAKGYEVAAEKAEKMAAEFKALLEPSNSVTVTLNVDTSQAEKGIKDLADAMERVLTQFEQVATRKPA